MSLSTQVNRAQQYADPLDTVLNQFFNGHVAAPASYGVDVREEGDQLVFDIDLPGFRKEEVDITLENQTLTISAQKAAAQPAEPGDKPAPTYYLRERRNTRFQRAFNLPDTIDGQTVNAKLQDGILTVTLNKRPETKPRKIEVA